MISRDEARRRVGISYDGPILLVFGAFHVRRGYETLFKAIGRIKSDLRVLVAGAEEPSVPGGLSKVKIEEMAILFDCYSRLILHEGYIPDDLLPYYFIASDIVVLLYLQNYDMSGPLILACTYGRRVLATRLGDIGATVSERQIGLVVDPESPAEVARAIQIMLEWSVAEQERVRQNCRALANAWSWANVARKFTDLYRATVAGEIIP